MKIIGLTGGIASGKSFVAQLFAERGAVVLDADRHAHAVLADPEVVQRLAERWGDEVVATDGTLNRPAVAKRVFGDSEAAVADREFLESLVHPRVRQALRAELETARLGGAPVAVLDIPLLYEAGWADECDAVVFVDTPDTIRLARVAQRGWSADELARREGAQLPIAQKRARAAYTVPGADEASARSAVGEIWAAVAGPA